MAQLGELWAGLGDEAWPRLGLGLQAEAYWCTCMTHLGVNPRPGGRGLAYRLRGGILARTGRRVGSGRESRLREAAHAEVEAVHALVAALVAALGATSGGGGGGGRVRARRGARRGDLEAGGRRGGAREGGA